MEEQMNMNNEAVKLYDTKATEGEYGLGIEHVREVVPSHIRELKDTKATEGEYDLGIEHVREFVPSHIRELKDTKATEGEYDLGIEHVREVVHSKLKDTKATEGEYGLGTEHIGDPFRSNIDDTKATDGAYELSIEHVGEPLHSYIFDAPEDTRKETEGEYNMEIEQMRRADHRICISSELECRKAIEGERDMGIEHGQSSNRLNRYDEEVQEIGDTKTKVLPIFFELLELVEKGDQAVEEHSIPRSEVLDVTELLHDIEGVDVARSVLEKEVEYMKNESDVHCPITQFQKEILEILLKICDTEACQTTICKLIGKAKGGRVSCKHCKVVQVNEEANQ
ncbi:hypothetical protein ACET3Z_033059 [Daucus carota]